MIVKQDETHSVCLYFYQVNLVSYISFIVVYIITAMYDLYKTNLYNEHYTITGQSHMFYFNLTPSSKLRNDVRETENLDTNITL